MLTILFLASNPAETTRLRLDKEFREIEENIKKSDYRDKLKLVSKWAVRINDLQQYINECNPGIIHFCGHGEKCEMIFESDLGKITVKKEAMVRLLKNCKNLKLVLFNVCKSIDFAKEIADKIDYAIGMKDSIYDKTAIVFSYRFYSSLGFGKSVYDAFEDGITEIRLYNYEGMEIPKLFIKDGIDKRIPLVESDNIIKNVKSNKEELNNSENKDTNTSIIRVFVSSTYNDLIDYRKAAERAVNMLGQKYEGMEYMGVDDSNATKACLEMVDKCDLFIGIYAWRYGYIPEGSNISITEQEYEYAKRMDIPCHCYLVDNAFPWNPLLMEVQSLSKLNEFKDKIMKEKVVARFKEPENLEKLIVGDLGKWLLENKSYMSKKIVRGGKNPIEKYLKAVAENYKEIKMVGFGKNYSMDDVYIPITVNLNNEEKYNCIRNKKSLFSNLLTAEDLIDLNDKVNIVLGEPGMGKTTMLHYLARKDSLKKDYIPVFIKLSNYSENTINLKEYIRETIEDYVSGEELPNILEDSLDKGKILVLLDGLDEIRKDKYKNVINKIEAFISVYKDCKVIITSRKTGFEKLRGVKHVFEITKLPLDKIEEFIKKWFGSSKKANLIV
jgi:hypothetical protein